MSKAKNGARETALHKALSHPLRARILHELERRGTLSPSRFATEPPPGQPRVSLNLAAYHFRVLVNHDVIETVEENTRRGATERVYAINPDSPVPDVMHVSSLIVSLHIDEAGREELNGVLTELKASLATVGHNCRARLRPSKRAGERLQVAFAAVGSASERQQPARDLSKAHR